MASQPLNPASKDETMINVLVSSFRGLGLPNTLCMAFTPATTIKTVYDMLSSRLSLDLQKHAIKITTHSNLEFKPSSNGTLSTLLSGTAHAPLLSLRLTPPTLGGKGGFGSQLRAAGGRMSSRKNKRQSAEQQNGSNRNLDGRRLRTITEAKNLATYLAMKPDMDKKERDEKRKRWEAVVEAAERKQEEVRTGKGGNVRLDGQWVEQKEEAESKTRDAVLAAMKAGLIGNDAAMLEITGSETSASGEDGDSDEVAEGEASNSSGGEEPTSSKPTPASAAPATRTFFGWDEDDEDMSDDENEDEDEDAPVQIAYEGKGKGKA